MDKFNAIEAAIEHFGGGAEGVREVAYLLKVTSTRVYQMRDRGVVTKPAHALLLAQATKIRFQDFLIPRGEAPTGARPNGGGHKPAKSSGGGRTSSRCTGAPDRVGVGLHLVEKRAA